MPTIEIVMSDLAGRYKFCTIFHEDFKKYRFHQSWTNPADAQALPGLPAQFIEQASWVELASRRGLSD